MEMPLTDRDQIVRLAKCYEGLRSNIRRDYALENMPKRFTPGWRRTLEADERHSPWLSALNADTWLSKHLEDAAKRGSLTQAELKKIARWKFLGPKLRMLIQENCKCEVREISSASFAAKSERLCIGALLALHGVNWPMASTILHLVPVCVFPERMRGGYPVLDKKTMTAVKGSANYNFKRWMEYTELCRDTAQKFNVTLRELDRALWVWGDEKRSVSP